MESKPSLISVQDVERGEIDLSARTRTGQIITLRLRRLTARDIIKVMHEGSSSEDMQFEIARRSVVAENADQLLDTLDLQSLSNLIVSATVLTLGLPMQEDGTNAADSPR